MNLRIYIKCSLASNKCLAFTNNEIVLFNHFNELIIFGMIVILLFYNLQSNHSDEAKPFFVFSIFPRALIVNLSKAAPEISAFANKQWPFAK